MIMNKTVHIDFNQKSISDLISKLEVIHNDMKNYPDRLAKEKEAEKRKEEEEKQKQAEKEKRQKDVKTICRLISS